MRRLTAAVVLACTLLTPCAARAAAPAQTATGIALDAPWKATVYAFAQATFKHPAWGWQHSERDYRLAVEVAQGDRLAVDTDVPARRRKPLAPRSAAFLRAPFACEHREDDVVDPLAHQP